MCYSETIGETSDTYNHGHPWFSNFLSPFIGRPGGRHLAGYLPGYCICVPDSLSIELE